MPSSTPNASSPAAPGVDAGILADITAAVKLDLGNLLTDIDANILVDLKVRLDAQGLMVKADVDLVLGLNLGAILGGVVGDCEDSKGISLRISSSLSLPTSKKGMRRTGTSTTVFFVDTFGQSNNTIGVISYLCSYLILHALFS